MVQLQKETIKRNIYIYTFLRRLRLMIINVTIISFFEKMNVKLIT
jgi:hypothetical protein